MIIFPLIYISSFLFAVKEVLSRNKQGIFIFLILGLPIYITSLSVAFQSGFGSMIPFMQSLKELLVLITLGVCLWELKGEVKLQIIDYAVFGYFAYTLLYVFLPIGQYGILTKIIALKGASFFVLVYFTGRLFNPAEIYISKYFHYILLASIAATAVLAYEILKNQHFQSLTGYADLNFYHFNQEATGNYGLTWTFETSTGLKRFSSFFSNPLEFAAATLLALAVIAGIYTTDDNKFKVDTFGAIAIGTSQFAILFALSRASLASYFIMIYVYAVITKRKEILYLMYTGLIAIGIYVTYFLINTDLYEFIYETVTFTNPSSLGHIIAWLEGINAMIRRPFGLGLGESGRLAATIGEGVGGENQFIIIGVQTGIPAMLLYLFMQVSLIRLSWLWYPKLSGKAKKVCLTVLLMKIGFIIPLLTSELESSVYISYISWFLSGLMVNMIYQQNKWSAQHEAIENRN